MIKKLLSCFFPAENDSGSIATNVPNYGANASQGPARQQASSDSIPFGSSSFINNSLQSEEEPRTPPRTRQRFIPNSSGSTRSIGTSSTLNNSPDVNYQHHGTDGQQPDLDSHFGDDLGSETHSQISNPSSFSASF